MTSHSSPNDGQGFAASTSTAVDGRGDASTLQETPALLPEQSAEVRNNDRGELDEFIAKGADVHLEQMDNGHWWLGVTTADGAMWHLNFTTKRNAPIACFAEQDGYAARASTPVGWQALQDELVAALRRSKAWIEVQMEEELGWPRDRIKNPPEGSHLHAINAALAKVAAPSATPESQL